MPCGSRGRLQETLKYSIILIKRESEHLKVECHSKGKRIKMGQLIHSTLKRCYSEVSWNRKFVKERQWE